MNLRFLLLITFIFLINCRKESEQRKEVLLADREAPIDWIYLKMYNNYTFQFISAGIRNDDDMYSETYSLKSDTIYFKYKDSIPNAGSKAVIENGYVNYLDGSYPERIQIKLNKLLLKK
ncbi:hypothetical protein [Chryseobacterium sp.]|uniref:hypothetical protein n=1 Tax=Chryseobacterium sp. TaxID=1871047 RepID=UPI0028A1E51A|nr:hypothetical protein [Chryseobacterium sp.]